MKKLYACLTTFALFLISSCVISYVQLYETKALSTTNNRGNIFENDTLKIEYSFWSENGAFSFSVFNKLNVPLYLDWKKSSFIKNNDKFNYWNDVVQTESIGVVDAVSTAWGNSLFSSAVGYSQSIATKPEQITFIPPHSTIYKLKFQLKETPPAKFKAKYRMTDTASTFSPSAFTKIKYKSYDELNSPLLFRNFMTFSTSDKFEKEFFVDNGFYLAKITELDRRQLAGKKDWMGIDLMKAETPFKNKMNYFVSLSQ